MLNDPTNGEPTKISRRYLEDGKKVRISKLTGNVIPKPDPLADRKPRSIVVGLKDTPPEDVTEVTFTGYDQYVPYIYSTYATKKEAQAKKE
jgi:large subunit ribosomal protein L24